MIRALGELLVFALALLTVWPFGSVKPDWEFVAVFGIAILVLLWSIHSVIIRRWRIEIDGIVVALGGMILLSVVQLVPLPIQVVRVVSPAAARLHETLRPAESERLPGETTSTPRPLTAVLSVEPESTKNFAVRAIAILLLYCAVRNWLATRGALKRMAWGGMITGVALSLLALGQFFSPTPNKIYWTFLSQSDPFGPFPDHNHYASYMALCVGWTLALLLGQMATSGNSRGGYPAGPLEFLTKPAAFAAAIALGLMLLGVLFSLSRGGTISVFVVAIAVWFFFLSSRMGRGSRIYLLVFSLAVGGGALYFGIKPLENRFHSTLSKADDRLPLWRGALSQVPGFYLFGSGNGTFQPVEPLARVPRDITFVFYKHAHNEYIEALVEGGICRFALTCLLVGTPIVAMGRAYRRRGDGASGPYLLGAWFGVTALALHALTEFGHHTPAVALFAAVTAGFGMAATGPEFGHKRKRIRKGTASSQPGMESASAPPEANPKRDSEGVELRGLAAVAITSTVIVVFGAFAAWDRRNFARAESYYQAARYIGRPTEDDEIEYRLELLRAAVALRPTDATYRRELGNAELEASTDRYPAVIGSVVGSPGATLVSVPSRMPAERVELEVLPGLRNIRLARDLSPLYPVVHLQLGQYRQYFTHAEPRLAYLERAKILNRADPNIWHACGVEELAAGNEAAACDNWRRSLELSAVQLAPIVAAARKHWSAADVLARVLPLDNPAVLLQAAEMYADQPVARKAILERAADAAGRPGWDSRQRIAIAKATEALGRYDGAEAVWKAALDASPEDFDVHNGAAEFYEREERYGEALNHLNWMIRKSPGNGGLRDRALAARHGIELQEKLKD